MSSTWSLKLPNLLLKKIRGSKENSNPCNSSHGASPLSNIYSPAGRPLSLVEDQLTRDCKEFYERRVQLTAKADEDSSGQGGPSSLCSSGYFSLPYLEGSAQQSLVEEEEEEEDPLQSKIHHLRKEFLSLIEVDNQLFKQLLNLNDAIQDFKELHASRTPSYPLPEVDDESEEGCSNRILRSKSFLEETKTFQRQRISFPATRRNRRGHSSASFEEEDPSRLFYTLPSSKAKKKISKEQRESLEWRGSSSRSSASSASSASSYERRSWKRYSETNNSLDSGIHADSSGENSDHYSP